MPRSSCLLIGILSLASLVVSPEVRAAPDRITLSASGSADEAATCGIWSQDFPDPVPLYRSFPYSVHDGPRRRMVMFGGQSGYNDFGTANLNDLWAYAYDTQTWSTLTAIGTAPSPRGGGASVWDPAGDRILFLCGATDGFIVVDEVWSLSLSGTPQWELLAPTGTPPSARWLNSAAYDPRRNRVLMFGGDGGLPDELWELDLSGPSPAWSQIVVPGGPSMNRAVALVDSTRDQLIVVGLQPSYPYSTQLWTLSFSGAPQWTRWEPASGVPQMDPGFRAVFDQARDRVILSADKTWAIDWKYGPESIDLTPLVGTSSDELLRWPAMALDPDLHQLVRFAGENQDRIWSDDQYTLPLSTQADVAIVPPGEGAVSRDPAGCVSDGTPVAFAAQPNLGHFFTHWSGDASGTTNPIVLSANGHQVLVAHFVQGPPVLTSFQPAEAPPFSRVTVRGGAFTGTTEVAFNGTAGTFTVFGDTLIWADVPPDATSGLITITTPFGTGTSTTSFVVTPAYSVQVSAEPAWAGSVDRSPNQPIYLPGTVVTLWARPVLGAVFSHWSGDASGTQNLVSITVNGPIAVVAHFVEVPALCGKWTPQLPHPVPPTRTHAYTIHDPLRRRMIVFGGQHGYNTYGDAYLNDVWAYSFDTHTWSALTAENAAPSPRGGGAAVWDSKLDRMILLCGRGNAGVLFNEVWSLSLSGIPHWDQLVPSGAAPLKRWLNGAAYDAPRNRILMFGGDGGLPAELWELDLSGSTPVWGQLTTSGGPAGISSLGLIDSTRNRLVLMGGGLWTLSLTGAPGWTQWQPASGLPTWHSADRAVFDYARDRIVVSGDETWAIDWKHGPESTNLTSTVGIPWQPYGPWAYASMALDPQLDRIVRFGGGPYGGETDAQYVLPFGLQADVAIAPPGKGTVTRSPEGCVPMGTPVTFTAQPNFGYLFSHWSGDATGSTNPLVLESVEHHALVAHFVVGPPFISSFHPTQGPFYTPVTILGFGFAGATQVAFNGVPAPLP